MESQVTKTLKVFMSNTSSKDKLTAYLKERSKVTDKEIPPLLKEIRRFVAVVHKIYTEPQYQTRIKEKKVDGKIVKYTVIDTDLEEFAKIKGKSETQIPLNEAIKRFNSVVNKGKHGGE